MHFTLFTSLAVAFYLIATALIILSLRTEHQSVEGKSRVWPRSFSLAGVAALFHILSLTGAFWTPSGINFNFFSTGALVVLIVVLLLLTAGLTKPVEKLGLVIFPLAALSLALKAAMPGKAHWLHNLSPGMEIHILVSILAYSLLNIAAVQAILLALQDWQLRHHHPHRLVRSLPPLQTMESLLFQMIGIGFVLLTASLLSGFLFLDDLFAQHLAHKTVLSILAWLVFAVLLWGRVRYGWRGQTAIRWTLSGFVALMLAYFGSKLVLELILERV